MTYSLCSNTSLATATQEAQGKREREQEQGHPREVLDRKDDEAIEQRAQKE